MSAATATPLGGTEQRWQVTVQPQGWQFTAPATTPLAQAARQAGIRLRVSCQNGSCRACLCRLASGSVSYAIDWPGVSADERRDGWVLPCIARPTSDLVLTDADARRAAAAE